MLRWDRPLRFSGDRMGGNGLGLLHQKSSDVLARGSPTMEVFGMEMWRSGMLPVVIRGGLGSDVVTLEDFFQPERFLEMLLGEVCFLPWR